MIKQGTLACEILSKGIQVSGALRVNLMFNSDWHVKYSMIMIEILLFCLI